VSKYYPWLGEVKQRWRWDYELECWALRYVDETGSPWLQVYRP
jgi:hypothetical protein